MMHGTLSATLYMHSVMALGTTNVKNTFCDTSFDGAGFPMSSEEHD